MKTNKILALILAVAMIMSTMGIVASADIASADVWDGTYDTSWYDENDKKTEYTLTTAAQFAGFAKLQNEYPDTMNHLFMNVLIKLDTDIDLGNLEWAPIGYSTNNGRQQFKGMFDGQGHTIYNLNVPEKYTISGLFGQLNDYDSEYYIKNVTIVNATVANDGTSKSYAGALVGRANGYTIENCHVRGNVNIAGYSFVGGLIGHSQAKISNCTVDATGTITAKNWQCGGLVGAQWVTETSCVTNCSVSGDDTNGGLSISSQNGAVAGIAGIVVMNGAETTTLDDLSVEDVEISTSNTTNSTGYIATGYTATNSTSIGVVVTDSNNETITPEDAEGIKVAVAKINGVVYYSLKEALKAYYNDANATTIELLADATYDSTVEGYPWDARNYSGDNYCYATFTKPTVIEGNSHTLTFKGEIKDGNRDAIFRPEADTTFRNLTIDASQLKGLSYGDGRFSAISSGKCDLTVENCTFIGTTQYPKTRAIIFAEGAGKDLSEIEINVTGSTFINWENGVRDNFNGQDVSNVTVSDSDFENASVTISAAEKITFTNNEMEDGWVDIRSYSDTNNLTVVATGNTLTAEGTGTTQDNYIEAAVIETDEEFTTTAVAKVNGKQYGDLKKAVDAAAVGSTITLLDNIEVSESVVIGKDLTIDGTDAKYTIKGADGIDTNVPSTTPIKVTNANVTLKNVNVIGGAGDEMNSSTVAAYGAYAVIAEDATLTVENATLSGGDVNAEFVVVGGAIDAKNSDVVVKDSVLETGKQADGINNSVVFPVVISDNDSELEISNTTLRTNIPANMYTADAVLIAGSDGQGGFYEIETPVDMYDTIKIEGVVPLSNVDVNVPAGKQIKIEGKVAEDMFIPASEITVNLVPVDAADPENNEFYINLTAGANTKIFEFESAQLTFKNESKTESTNARMPYDVLGENGVEVIRNTGINDGVNAEKQTFGLYLNDKATLTDEHNTGAEITIGKIVFSGKGAMKMSVVAEESEVVATKVGTFDEAHYTLNATKDASYSLVAGSAIGSTSQHEKRDVKICVEFEHDMDNVAADADSIKYRDIKVTLKDATGVSVTKDIEMKNVLAGEVTFDNVLVGIITVTLKADGFRTYTYQTTIEDGTSANGELVLNFWNSVKRGKTLYIEEGKDRSNVAHNFLVGDIAMDYIIDKYDLAAVTSYYGIYDIKATEADKKFVKYDLNRDHQIDILDVAYVLHGMGN